MQMRYGPHRRPAKAGQTLHPGRKTRGRLTALRMAACLLLLGGVTILRACFPDATETVRTTVLPMMEEDIDYRGAITALGETLSGEASILEVLGDIAIWAFGGSPEEDVEVQAQPEEVEEEEERPPPPSTSPPIEPIIPTPFPEISAPQEPPEEYPEVTEMPEVVEVFLAQQAPFSHYPLPPGVSFAYVPLDFEHAPPLLGPVSSPFGFRQHPIHRDVRFHFGTDIAVYTGTPIGAFAAGEVRAAGHSDSFGLYILIDHPGDIRTRYAHLSVLYVQSGDSVELGQVIGRTGSTGSSTGPHLHFELQVNGVFKNPEFYIRFNSS